MFRNSAAAEIHKQYSLHAFAVNASWLFLSLCWLSPRYVQSTEAYAFEETGFLFFVRVATAETNYIGERRNFFLHGQASVPRGGY